MNIIDFSRQFIGKQETEGSNQGPLIRRWRHEVLGGGDHGQAIPWCGIAAFAVYMEFNSLSRKDLIEALGFPLDFYPESADSWAASAKKVGKITASPKIGDVFLWMRITPTGYSYTDAHHVGIVTESIRIFQAGISFRTIEGNTVRGGINSKASREGDGFYERSRIWYPEMIQFVSISEALKNRPDVLKPKVGDVSKAA